MDYGKTREKIYLAIRGIIEKYSCLDLTVRNVSYSWHETSSDRIKKINKKTFLQNATPENIARFYNICSENNALLNYPKEFMESFKKYDPCFEDNIENYKFENKSSIKLKLEKLSRNNQLSNRRKEKERSVR